jgi:hypothetical protein
MIPHYHLVETFEILERLTTLFKELFDLKNRAVMQEGVPRILLKIEKLQEVFTGFVNMRKSQGFHRF